MEDDNDTDCICHMKDADLPQPVDAMQESLK